MHVEHNIVLAIPSVRLSNAGIVSNWMHNIVTFLTVW